MGKYASRDNVINGLNADKLDGQHGSYYATASHGHTTLVPYTGASGNVDLGVHDMILNSIKISDGAVDGYYWKCINADGTGEWAAISASQVYKGTVDGEYGTVNGTASELMDGNGTSGDYYRCINAGTYDYGNPSGNSITLALGDEIHYNGTHWQKIPGVGYTLQVASDTVLGGIKIGSGITMTGEVASVSTAYAPTVHNLIDTTNHPVSGLTTGHFLKALSATTYGFAAHGLTYASVGAAKVDQTFYLGTTQIAINRTSGAISLTGVNIDGSAGSAVLASTIPVLNTNADSFVGLFESATGNLAPKTNANIKFDAVNKRLNVTSSTNEGGIYSLGTSAPVVQVKETYLNKRLTLGVASNAGDFSNQSISGNSVISNWNTDMIFTSLGDTTPGGFKWAVCPYGGTETMVMKVSNAGNLWKSVEDELTPGLIFYKVTDGPSYPYGGIGVVNDDALNGGLSIFSIHAGENLKAATFAHDGALTLVSSSTATDHCNTSDIRLKDNIKPLHINPINVNYREFEFKNNPGQKRFGVIAQEVEKNYPELVRTDKNGTLSVSYIDLLVRKFAYLEQEVEKLKNGNILQ